MENLPEHDELQKELAHLRAECVRLRVENANLKNQAVIVPITQSIHSQSKNSQAILSTEQKIALFQRLFRGREDVYAIRWQNKQGRSGYSPACGNEWHRTLLDTLFLALPISWQGTLQQYVGRLHRSHAHKKEVLVYDYVDANVPALLKMYQKRLKKYRSMGYGVEEHTN